MFTFDAEFNGIVYTNEQYVILKYSARRSLSVRRSKNQKTKC